MASTEEELSAELDEVGPRLREARRARGWTLEALARAAGLSSSTLSRLEAGKRRASLELLLPVTRTLGIRIDDLIVSEPADPRIQRQVIYRDGLTITPLASPSALVHIYRTVFPAGRPLPTPITHDGFEWMYVISGQLRLHLGHSEIVLNEREAAEFDTHTPHAMTAFGDAPCEVMNIFNADGERARLIDPHASANPQQG